MVVALGTTGTQLGRCTDRLVVMMVETWREMMTRDAMVVVEGG